MKAGSYRKSIIAAVAAASVMSACSDATSPNDPLEIPAAVILPIVGNGTITDRYTAEVAVAGNVAYTTTWGSRPQPGNTTYVWNIAGNTPVLVDSLQVAGVSTMGDVQISPDGKYLVVATERSSGSIVVYDRTNPLHPTLITRFLNAHTTAGVHTMKMSVVNGKLYGFLQIDPGGTSGARLTIIEMTDPSKITEVYSQVMGSPFIHDVFVRDGLLFAALWNDGLSIFDIGGGGTGGTPSSPQLIGSVATATGQIHNVWWFHDPRNGSKKYLFLGEEGPGAVGSASSGDIHVIDATNMANPVEVASFTVGGAGTHNFWVDEASGVLYAAYYNAGVRALDIRGDLGTCAANQKTLSGHCSLEAMGRLLGKGLTGGAYYIWGVQGLGNRLYASDMNSGIVTLDISALKR